MYGPPGCGKTFIAKAIAGEIDAEFIAVSIHEALSQFIGRGEQALHDIFQNARRKAPCVLFFDEIDAISVSRTKGNIHMRGLVNTLLDEMDGFKSDNEGVLIIGATNTPWEVDDALRRPGRFAKILFVPPPDAKAREQIFYLTLKGKPTGSLDYSHLARLSRRFSAADINHACNLAVEKAFRLAMSTGKAVPITQEMLTEILAEVRSTVLEWLDTAQAYVTYSNQSGLYSDVKEYLERSAKGDL